MSDPESNRDGGDQEWVLRECARLRMTDPENNGPISEAHWYATAIGQVRGTPGNAPDRDMAEQLLREFAQLADLPPEYDEIKCVSTPLARYVAVCIKRWLRLNLQSDFAAHCFNVEMPSHRPPARPTDADFIALRTYFLSRANADGKVAAIAAAIDKSNLAEDKVRYLVESKHDDADTLRWAVLLDFNKDTRNRALHPPKKKHQRSR